MGVTYSEIESLLRRNALTALAVVSAPTDGFSEAATESIILVGPYYPNFWPEFSASPEFSDGQPDPMDRWSKRVVTPLANDIGGRAIFPSDGPPYPPFISWALASGAIWQSPVGLLVHASHGLMLSFRGAIALPYRVTGAPTAANPCLTCADKPCKTACPVNALQPDSYDVTACHGALDRPEVDCMALGCAARRACPISQMVPRSAAQSAFHMRAFHKKG